MDKEVFFETLDNCGNGIDSYFIEIHPEWYREMFGTNEMYQEYNNFIIQPGNIPYGEAKMYVRIKKEIFESWKNERDKKLFGEK